jgi:hypothetical protein
VFCGASADSKEHVFAKRLFKRAAAARLPVVSGLYHETAGTKKRPSHFLDTFEVRCVCTACNTQWMNDLESWFESRLGCLIEPAWPKLAVALIDELKKEGPQLARWLLKTAITFNQACIKGAMRVEFPPQVAQSLKVGHLPSYCWVDLAYSKLSTVGGVISKGFRVIDGGKYNPNQIFSQGVGFRFAVQINHLLLRIARTPGVNVRYLTRQGELPMRLYPTPSPRIPEHFAYEDIMDFEHAVFLETGLSGQGAVP